MLPVFYALGAVVYQVYYAVVREARAGLAARSRVLLRPAVRHRSRAGAGVRRRLPLRPGALYRAELSMSASSICRCACWCRAWCRWRWSPPCRLFLTKTFIGRAIMAVAQDQLALQLMAASPTRIKRDRVRDLDRDLRDRRRAAHHHPAGRAVGRARIYRARVRHLRARRARQHSRHADRRDDARHPRELHLDLLRAILGAGRRVRRSAAGSWHSSRPACSDDRTAPVRTSTFALICVVVGARRVRDRALVRQ